MPRSSSPIPDLYKALHSLIRRGTNTVNQALRQYSPRGQRTLLLIVGIALAILCVYQIVHSLRRPSKVRPLTPISLPIDILRDTTGSLTDPRVVGVLIPRRPGFDSLWVAASIHRRFFIGNRIRWLEIPIDSRKAFRDTHDYKPIR
jgi:hypothetical protein